MQVIRKSKKERKSKAAPLIFSINWISFFQNHNRYLLRIKEGASVVLYTLDKDFVISATQAHTRHPIFAKMNACLNFDTVKH